MSIDQANHYILTHHPKTTGTSPLYHPPLTLNRSRFNPNLLRAPLQTRMQQSPNIHSSSPEPFSAGPISSLLSNIDTRRPREPKSSFLPSRHFRNNLEARLQEIVSPSALEPESSSSQPSEPVSGTCRDSSPFLATGDKVSVVEDNGDMFSEELYRRINEFLDAEGLELADPVDHMQGIRMFSKARMLEEEDDGRQEQELFEIKGVQSANHSPKLIADNLFSSTLLQRRSCRSQGPKEAMISLDALEKPKGKLNVGIFRHFKDDLNQILQTASPIEEKLTPVISRNNSGFYENTPDRLGPKKFSFKHLKSPEPSEGKGVSRLAKYTIKSIKSFKSPHQPRINAMQSVSEISPLKSSKDTEGSSSLCSSPVMIIPSSSPGKEMQLESAVRSSRSNHGKVMRKSRFQTLRDLQE